MASITLDFVPPGEEGVTALNVYESASQNGVFTIKQTTTAVGTYPDYISRFEFTQIDNPSDWFAISWTINGIEGELSQAIKGGTTTLVQKIVNRVHDRDSSLNERVVTQEAEAAIQMIYGETADPYDPNLASSISYRKLNGLTNLVMARSLIARTVLQSAASGTLDSATLGLVSFKSGTTTSAVQRVAADVEALIEAANRELGITTSFVMLMDEIEEPTYPTYDHSRLVSGYVSIE